MREVQLFPHAAVFFLCPNGDPERANRRQMGTMRLLSDAGVVQIEAMKLLFVGQLRPKSKAQLCLAFRPRAIRQKRTMASSSSISEPGGGPMSRLEATYMYIFIDIYSYLWSVAVLAQDVIKLTKADTPELSRFLS